MPLQGWDGWRIVTQITALQTIHYTILAAMVPAMLAVFADTSSLMFEGGPTQVGMVFDWHQLAGSPTYDWKSPTTESWWNSSGPIDSAITQWNLDNIWISNTNVIDHNHILRFKDQKLEFAFLQNMRNHTTVPLFIEEVSSPYKLWAAKH